MVNHQEQPPSPNEATPASIGELVDTAAAVRFLGISESWLRKARITGGGPDYLKFGGSVRYHVPSLGEWAREQVRSSTSEYPTSPHHRRNRGSKKKAAPESDQRRVTL